MFLEKNSKIVNQICSKSTCYTSKIIFNKYGNYYVAEAQNHEFRNYYTLLNGYPLWMVKEHDSFKCLELFSDNYLCYNKWAMFVANNAFECFMDGNKLKFSKYYFVFDFDLYSNLYHFNDNNLAEIDFINMLYKYRYDVVKLENIIQSKKVGVHEKVIVFLIEFYKNLLKKENTDKK